MKKTNMHATTINHNFRSKKFMMMWTTIAIFVIATVYFTIHVSATGAELSELEKEKSLLVETNLELAAKLMQKTSLTHIQSESENRGFGKIGKLVFLKGPEVVADLQKTNLE